MSKVGAKNRRLMDHLPGDHRWGELLGVLATTYEFDAHFFEGDFLPALLKLGSWADSGWASRIALEKGLASLDGVWIASDQRKYRSRPTSLRVELRPAIGPSGSTLHAKALVLVYERAVRVQVGSANLTEAGYRNNREVVLSVAATEDAPEHVELAGQVLEGMPERLAPWWSPAAHRVFALATERIALWKRRSGTTRFVWSDGNSRLWPQVVAAWPEGDALESIVIVSPFWSEEGSSGPLKQLVGGLRGRGRLPPMIPVRLLTEAEPSGGDSWRPRLPPLGPFEPAKLGIALTAQAVLPTPTDEGNAKVLKQRALHAKVVLLRGKQRAVAYVGSGNFTVRGWGFGTARANIEAGLIVSGPTQELERSVLPPTTGPVVELTPKNLPPGQENTESDAGIPTFVLAAWLEPVPGSDGRLQLRIVVDRERAQGDWWVSLTSGGEPLLEVNSEGPNAHVIQLTPEMLEALLRDHEFLVGWGGGQQTARYPLNVTLEARDTLPVAPGRAEPGESALLAYYQGRIRFEDLYPPPPGWVDEDGGDVTSTTPVNESAVDTRRIQSYQVREFVEALEGIRQELRAVSTATEASMRRAVLGAVSPVALAREIELRVKNRERTPTAAGFELVELGGCLGDARGHSKRPQWTAVIEEGLAAIRDSLNRVASAHAELGEEGGAFRKYAKSVLGWSPGRTRT